MVYASNYNNKSILELLEVQNPMYPVESDVRCPWLLTVFQHMKNPKTEDVLHRQANFNCRLQMEIVRMKTLARSWLWRPVLDNDVKQLVKQCSQCQEASIHWIRPSEMLTSITLTADYKRCSTLFTQ
ncbi:hypothetical protein T11_762 [Trichinella zimbabwensis]|uniref:Integrase zinc-binding domain-containing protein n=1 Tax=Trichinella zimbabwensis TaxID=268475 RepID=A0A0V1I9J2_9BILA|nr:hypothetical protein T11_762 [Trichinella zimbabwensis]